MRSAALLGANLRVPAGILLFALLARVLSLLVTKPPFESQYWALSDSLLKDGSLGFDDVRTTAFEPGYPLFLAMARVLVGHRVLLVQVVQCIVAALGAWFLYRLARALTGRWHVGAIAGVLYAAYPLLIRHSADRTDTALMTMLMVAFASEFVAAVTPVRAAMAGVWLGFAVLTRAMALPLIPLAAAVQWRTKGWRAAAWMTLTALLVTAPYAIRNYSLNGAIMPTRSGLNLFISNSEHTANIFPDYGPDILGEYVESILRRETRIGLPPSPALEREQDAFWTQYALEEMRRNPRRTVGLKARNVLYFFSPRLVPYHELNEATRIRFADDGQFAVENSPPREVLHQIVYTISYTPVFALAVMGVWRRRGDLRRDAILWCVLISFVAAHALYFPTTRYRVPVEFVLLFYAAVTLDHWIFRAQRRR